jgi:hypothetical protein
MSVITFDNEENHKASTIFIQAIYITELNLSPSHWACKSNNPTLAWQDLPINK